MSTVELVSLDDLRSVVADLLDAARPLVVGRQDARRLLDLSDTTFGRLVRDGHVRPVPHLRPAKYSVELLRRFAAGDGTAFAHLDPAGAAGSAGGPLPPSADPSGPSGTAGADRRGGGSVSPLPLRSPAGEEGAGGPDRTARGGPTTPAA